MKKAIGMLLLVCIFLTCVSSSLAEIVIGYSFDEMDGKTVKDTFGNYDATISSKSKSAIKDGKVGKALNCGRAFIDLPDDLMSKFDDFTFAAWVYWNDDDGGMQRIFDFGHDGGDPAFWLSPNWQYGGFLALRTNIHFGGEPFIGGGAYKTENVTLSEGEDRIRATGVEDRPHNTIWTADMDPYLKKGVIMEEMEWIHLAVTVSGNELTIYQNGVPLMTTTLGAFDGAVYFPELNTLTIGAHSNHFQDAFNGFIDEVYLFDRALGTEEVVEIMNNGYAAP